MALRARKHDQRPAARGAALDRFGQGSRPASSLPGESSMHRETERRKRPPPHAKPAAPLRRLHASDRALVRAQLTREYLFSHCCISAPPAGRCACPARSWPECRSGSGAIDHTRSLPRAQQRDAVVLPDRQVAEFVLNSTRAAMPAINATATTD